ncbi:PDDEXK nuclease domain-containing protein [uncultured Chitinophaga sp.]|uniref:PDDEXK nuclease domain-containing protein n=1 Tax=uncultured Chitinophaga sp. TaxID=339340 RepID=UPI0025EE4F98|nr:PDDEXK nuclease domain-containing protein [uncultured Chitinophaga sp.]
MHKQFINDIRQLLLEARGKVARQVNAVIVYTYWEIGRRIVEEEQSGSKRAEYGGQLLKELSARLVKEFGRGYGERDLRRIRQFYLVFPIRSSLRPELTWTHYRTLLGVRNEEARTYYLQEAVQQSWSVRQLERNIASLFFERLKPPLKDPYVLEFLGLDDATVYSESDIESAIIQNIQSFLLELGTGFAFVARQYRIKTETKVFYIDLVFYHYLLKCFVLIDLKVTDLSHQDIGQMDMYVRMFEALRRSADDQPTLGIILCKDKDQTIVKYSMLEESEQLFASSYSLVLPSEDALKAVLEQGFRTVG